MQKVTHITALEQICSQCQSYSAEMNGCTRTTVCACLAACLALCVWLCSSFSDWLQSNCLSCSDYISPPGCTKKASQRQKCCVSLVNINRGHVFINWMSEIVNTCVFVYVLVCVCIFSCHTYREVSERRPLKASAAMSEIWFLLRSLGRERDYCNAP